VSFRYPTLLALAVLLTAAAIVGYVLLARRRDAALAAAGLATRGRRVRQWLPHALMLAALPLLLVGAARPEAKLSVPRVSGTVVLVFDASNSMGAKDLKPNRLAASQAAATKFVEAQPGSIDIGVVVFGDQALTTQKPTADHDQALAAIKRVGGTGGTSLTQAILASLSAITGKHVTLPKDPATAVAPNLGYWPSATIVLFSDGEDTDDSNVEAATDLAANAGVHIHTVGVGTPAGATVEVDGYQLAAALDEQALTTIATTTGGKYHRAGDADSLDKATSSIDLRLTRKKQPVELTALFAGGALLLLAAGAVLMTRWHGRIV
jgi:Ca-activated chloride channel family protein